MDDIESLATGGYTCGDWVGEALDAIATDGYLCDIEVVQPGVSFLPAKVCARGLWSRTVEALGIAANDEAAAGQTALTKTATGVMDMEECTKGVYSPSVTVDGELNTDEHAAGQYEFTEHAAGLIEGCD